MKVFLPTQFTTVTKTSKILAAILFISLPFLGFYLGVLYSKSTSIETENLVAAPTPKITLKEPEIIKDDAEITENAMSDEEVCKTITGLKDYESCEKGQVRSIKFKGNMIINNVEDENFSVSPNGKWIFVVTYSDAYVLEGGAPQENALSMIRVSDSKVYELFSQIYFPNYDDKLSWNSTGDGIVLTAGEDNTPKIIKDADPFAVLYCKTSCKVLALDAGPYGIGGDKAYFENGLVCYTDKQEQKNCISVKQ